MNTVNEGVPEMETFHAAKANMSLPASIVSFRKNHGDGQTSVRFVGLASTAACPEWVKPQLEEKEGKTFDVFTAVEFKTQVVAGTNFFIKVHVGNDEFMHLRVFRSLPHDNKPLSLHSYQSSKTKHDELAFF
ncbi:PREDICTED: cystatin-B [Aptenodytes forsteri]|uniref:cystatin-B n=1 Tax=Aptenodytes forsteri TaxID=9233 RepID=UPI0004F43EA2|nr:PREDICTED: cystatin-B [Aptenodytes forsteri]